jgi:hypothetical protein
MVVTMSLVSGYIPRRCEDETREGDKEVEEEPRRRSWVVR